MEAFIKSLITFINELTVVLLKNVTSDPQPLFSEQILLFVATFATCVSKIESYFEMSLIISKKLP